MPRSNTFRATPHSAKLSCEVATRIRSTPTGTSNGKYAQRSIPNPKRPANMTSIGPSPRGSVLAAGVTAAVLMAVLSVGTANSMRHAKVATRYIDTSARHQAAVMLMSLTHFVVVSDQDRSREASPGSSALQAEDAGSIAVQEPRPYIIFEIYVRQLTENPLQRQAHREVAGVEHLVGSASVCVIDDGLRVVLRSEGRRRVVEVGPFDHQLHCQPLPRLAAMASDEHQFREIKHDNVDPGDILRRERQPRTRHARTDEDRDTQFDARRVDRVHLGVIDRHLRKGAGRKHRRRTDPEFLVLASDCAHRPDDVVGISNGPGRNKPVGMVLQRQARSLVGNHDHAL